MHSLMHNIFVTFRLSCTIHQFIHSKDGDWRLLKFTEGARRLPVYDWMLSTRELLWLALIVGGHDDDARWGFSTNQKLNSGELIAHHLEWLDFNSFKNTNLRWSLWIKTTTTLIINSNYLLTKTKSILRGEKLNKKNNEQIILYLIITSLMS